MVWLLLVTLDTENPLSHSLSISTASLSLSLISRMAGVPLMCVRALLRTRVQSPHTDVCIICMRTGARAGGHDYGNNHRSRASLSELEAGDYFVIIG